MGGPGPRFGSSDPTESWISVVVCTDNPSVQGGEEEAESLESSRAASLVWPCANLPVREHGCVSRRTSYDSCTVLSEGGF